jgi:hypothetical protein
MGAAQSKNSTDVVNKSLTDVVMKNTSSCKAQQGSKQTMIFGPINSDGCTVKISNISQDAKLSQNFSCIQDLKQDNDIINQISNKLKQDAEAKTSGFNLFNFAGSFNTSKAVNDVTSKIDLRNITDCIATNLQEQNFEQNGINIKCYPWMDAKDRVVDINNINQSIVSSQVANCLSKSEQSMKALNTFDNEIEQIAKSSVVGFGALGSAICCCCLLLLLIAYFVLTSDGGSSGPGSDVNVNIDPATAMKYAKYMV